MKMRTRSKDKGDTYIRNENFRLCTLNDFQKYYSQHYNYEDWLSEDSIKKRICPDMTGFEKFHRLKNGYGNKKERISFSVEIAKGKCSEEHCD